MPKPIPIAKAKEIAKQYEFDQVIIIARSDNGGHITTYGKTKKLCVGAGEKARKIAEYLGWDMESDA